ncbi:MAG: DUF342 domain-containing protein [Spartobacteria bacterium]|nr:DUF342 domain-containing protein [Spartobacteria bacterium]
MSEDVEILTTVQTTGYELCVALCERQTECRLSIRPLKRGVFVKKEDVLDVLREQGIRHLLELDLDIFCRDAAQGKRDDVLVARGKLPVPGRDAALELRVRPTTEKRHYAEDREGNVDFKNAGLFENVAAGTPIAVWHPAVPGEDGFTVTGKTLPAEPVNDFTIECGPNVERSADGLTFTALVDGRVIREDRRISVSDRFEIPRHVDFDVGNIDFIGHVIVRGDVMDGFSVRGRKSLTVEGNAGACTLQSDGDITITGMTGHDSAAGGHIQCGGNLQAKYLSDATVICNRTIQVQNEIIRSVVKCMGAVEVEGTLTGGCCVALGGVQVGQLGTRHGMETEVIAGIDYHYLDRVEQLQDDLENTQMKMEQVNIMLGPQSEKDHDDGNAGDMPETLRTRIRQLQKELTKLNEHADRLLQQLDDVGATPTETANPKVNVVRHANTGSVVRLSNIKHRLVEPLQGPVTLMERFGSHLFVTELTPLSLNVREIERLLDKTQA